MGQRGETENEKVTVILAGVLVASGVMAGGKPLQVSITPKIARFDRSETIEGLCLSIWGENPQKALAIGIVNGSTGRSVGLSWAFALNYADGKMQGLQSGVVNYAGRLTGLQFGFSNYAAAAETGVQLGFVNIIPDNAWFTELPEELAPGMVFVNWRF